jgi:hypothetical protein
MVKTSLDRCGAATAANLRQTFYQKAAASRKTELAYGYQVGA